MTYYQIDATEDEELRRHIGEVAVVVGCYDSFVVPRDEDDEPYDDSDYNITERCDACETEDCRIKDANYRGRFEWDDDNKSFSIRVGDGRNNGLCGVAPSDCFYFIEDDRVKRMCSV